MSSSAPAGPKSAVLSAVAPAGTNWLPPPSPPPSRLPRNRTVSAMISTACRVVPAGLLVGWGRARARPGHPAHGQVPHDAVRDLEDPRHLVERLRLALEGEQVIDPLALVVDLVREPPAAPRLVVRPRSAGLL